MKRFLITGGAGGLGVPLVKALCEQGHRVVVFDNESRGNGDRLKGIPNCFVWNKSDVCDGSALGTVNRCFECGLEGFTTVIHLAAVNGTRNFYENPSRVLEVGVKGIVNVMDACVAHGVRELFVASSSEVYQEAPVFPTPETVPLVVPNPHNPRYSYGASKIITEMMALHYKQESFDRIVVFRPHNIYGEGFSEGHVIPDLIRKVHEGRFELENTGERCSRAFCHVDDCVSGILSLLEKGKHREIYNIGTDRQIYIWQLADMIHFCMTGDREFKRFSRVNVNKSGGTASRWPDTTKLRSLGWEPKVSLEEGLRRTIAWYRENVK